MAHSIQEIAEKADEIVNRCGTRDPHKAAEELGIRIRYHAFSRQKGAYIVVLRDPVIILNDNLDPVTERIVLWHEIGHHVLHRKEASSAFTEYNLFGRGEDRMEYEANVFAAQASLPEDELLEYIEQGYSLQQTAKAMNSDANLVALKVDTLIRQGYQLRRQDHKNDFLGSK